MYVTIHSTLLKIQTNANQTKWQAIQVAKFYLADLAYGYPVNYQAKCFQRTHWSYQPNISKECQLMGITSQWPNSLVPVTFRKEQWVPLIRLWGEASWCKQTDPGPNTDVTAIDTAAEVLMRASHVHWGEDNLPPSQSPWRWPLTLNLWYFPCCSIHWLIGTWFGESWKHFGHNWHNNYRFFSLRH